MTDLRRAQELEFVILALNKLEFFLNLLNPLTPEEVKDLRRERQREFITLAYRTLEHLKDSPNPLTPEEVRDGGNFAYYCYEQGGKKDHELQIIAGIVKEAVMGRLGENNHHAVPDLGINPYREQVRRRCGDPLIDNKDMSLSGTDLCTDGGPTARQGILSWMLRRVANAVSYRK